MMIARDDNNNIIHLFFALEFTLFDAPSATNYVSMFGKKWYYAGYSVSQSGSHN